jgi:hypothetical protein
MELAQTNSSPKKRAISQNGQCLAPDGAALRKEKLAVTKIGGTISKIRYGIQWNVRAEWDKISLCNCVFIWCRPWAPTPNLGFDLT